MRVTLYLLRQGAEFGGPALRNPAEFRVVDLVKPLEQGVEWKLYVKQKPFAHVGWLSTISKVVQSKEELSLSGASAGAVLLIKTEDRVFAATFGTGFHALDPSTVEPDFGLRVAANAIDPKRVTLAEARGLGRDARNAVSSVPVPNEMFALRLVTDEEWVRRFSGHAVDKNFALTVSGADSLRLSVDGEDLQALPATLRRALALFVSSEYKKNFPYFDNFRRVARSDPRQAQLFSALDAQLRARPVDIGFAVPDEMNFATIDSFELKARRRVVSIDDLSPAKVFSAIDALGAWRDPLSEVRVVAVSDQWEPAPAKPLSSFVVSDVVLPVGHESAGRYVVTAGAWFKVDDDFAHELDRKIAAIPDVTAAVALPDWDAEWLKTNVEGNYTEERYNVHAASVLGHVLLDRKLYSGAAGERVEIADMLSKNRELLCVKRLDGSATMVHLFEQGALSAALLRRNEDYRSVVVDKLRELVAGADFGDPSDWTVVFAIATNKTGAIRDALPFFARASLVANAQEVRDRGYQVALARIQML